MEIYGRGTLQHIADLHNITLQQSADLMKRSNDIMPIITMQYQDDLDMISIKLREYQLLLLEEFKNTPPEPDKKHKNSLKRQGKI